MTAIDELVGEGQSIWLDAISRRLLSSGTLARYINDLRVTGLTSNPSILSHAIAGSSDYDALLAKAALESSDPEELVYELAIWDLSEASDLFMPVYSATGGRDGYVSIEVPPQFAADSRQTLLWAHRLHARFANPNVMIKVPGTPAGFEAVSQLIYEGIPVNVTLLFDADQYRAAAGAYLEGIERREVEGLELEVASVASVFVSRWDGAIDTLVPPELCAKAGLAVMQEIYVAYQELLDTARSRRLEAGGARPQRLLWASTSTKNPDFPDTYYLGKLAAPGTIDTVPEKTLLAFADHGSVDPVLGSSVSAARETIAGIVAHGVDFAEMAVTLQQQGAAAFEADWRSLTATVGGKVQKLGQSS